MGTASCGAVDAPPDSYWAEAGFVCFAGAHLAVVVVATALAAAFAAVVGVFAFVFVDSNPLSPGLRGTSSGRAALAMLLWKVREGGAMGRRYALLC